MNDQIPLATDLRSCGETKEKPPRAYFGKGDVIEFVGYQFRDLKNRTARVYAAKYTNIEELFCLVYSPDHHNFVEFPNWDKWQFAGGMTPIKFEIGKVLALETYLSNLSNGVGD